MAVSNIATHSRAAASLLLVAVLAGCGNDDDKDVAPRATVERTGTQAHVRNVTIHQSDFRIEPASVDAGSEGLVRIRIVNDGDVPHALAVQGPNGEVDFDGQIDPGHRGTMEVDLDRAGTYTMWCPLDDHRAKGMEATISVSGSAPARGAEPSGGATAPSTSTTPTETEATTQTQTVTETEQLSNVVDRHLS
jgi:plastocyanin